MGPNLSPALASETLWHSLMNEHAPILKMRRISPMAILAGILAASLLWAYWPTLYDLERTWSRDPRYSHGYLVPVFALYVLWLRRAYRSGRVGSRWIGVALFLAGGVFYFVGAYSYFSWLDSTSFLVSLGGLCALLGGRAGLQWAWPSIAFLTFMVPLPYRVETALGSSLQRLATVVSTYALQVLGIPAFNSGNTIIINDYTLGIIDACNGLGASYMVLACAVGAALLIHRPLVDKIILIASAIPIALVANATRVTLTGVLHEIMGKRAADHVEHDLAGWLTMPLALALLYVEYQLLVRLLIAVPDSTALAVGRNQKSTTPGQPPVPEMRKVRVMPFVVAICVVVLSGIVHGRWVNRWRISRDIELAVAKLDRLPMDFGDWRGRPQTVDRRALTAASLDGLVTRHYENHRTGRTTSLVLVCGRPGPVSVHTPEICYPGAGFEMAQSQPARFSVSPGGRAAEFLKADFERQESFSPERVRVYWSWNATGTWSVPENPRLTFASRPLLYKLYLATRITEVFEQSADNTETEFLRQFLPELERTLFPDDRPR
jgi:exosortase